jgi:hypothetical protein
MTDRSKTFRLSSNSTYFPFIPAKSGFVVVVVLVLLLIVVFPVVLGVPLTVTFAGFDVIVLFPFFIVVVASVAVDPCGLVEPLD